MSICFYLALISEIFDKTCRIGLRIKKSYVIKENSPQNSHFFKKNTVIFAEIIIMKIEGFFSNMVLNEKNEKLHYFEDVCYWGQKLQLKSLI